MTILIDEARWWFKERRWCHLVSDASLDELHGSRPSTESTRRGFQGDHYDIPEEFRPELIAGGALVVTSRELLRRLRDAGLRLSPTERRQFTNSGGSPN